MKPPTTIQDLNQLLKRVIAQLNAMELSPLFTEVDKTFLRMHYNFIIVFYKHKIAALTNEIQVTDLTSL
jgi:hypothetical protein